MDACPGGGVETREEGTAAWLSRHPALLLQKLIQFDTTNPPGNERACISFLRDLLEEAGCRTTLLARDLERPNLLARCKGRGAAPPLLLQGHIDVVPAAGMNWRYPPFAGEITDGMVWGRGAVDMKGGIAMMVGAFLRALYEQPELPGDVILALVVDEEAGGRYGAQYLVEQHAEYFQGVHYALGETGGNPVYIAGQKFVPISVLEKHACWVKAVITGPGGHSATPRHSGTTIEKLTQFLHRIEKKRLPIHITPVPYRMLTTIARALPSELNEVYERLLDPAQAGALLSKLGPAGADCEALLSHTINVTGIHGGGSFNVLPSRIEVSLDGRILPGYSAHEFLAELAELAGPEVQLEIVLYDEGQHEANFGLFSVLEAVLQRDDSSLIVLPALQSVTTDARFFARLGIQTYGFLPTNLQPGIDLFKGVHGENECLPVSAVEYGTRVIYEVLQRNRE